MFKKISVVYSRYSHTLKKTFEIQRYLCDVIKHLIFRLKKKKRETEKKSTGKKYSKEKIREKSTGKKVQEKKYGE